MNKIESLCLACSVAPWCFHQWLLHFQVASDIPIEDLSNSEVESSRWNFKQLLVFLWYPIGTSPFHDTSHKKWCYSFIPLKALSTYAQFYFSIAQITDIIQ